MRVPVPKISLPGPVQGPSPFVLFRGLKPDALVSLLEPVKYPRFMGSRAGELIPNGVEHSPLDTPKSEGERSESQPDHR